MIRKYWEITLVFHSTEDDVIPYTHAEEILRYAPENSKLIILTGSHHKNQHENYDLYLSSLEQYLVSLGQ